MCLLEKLDLKRFGKLFDGISSYLEIFSKLANLNMEFLLYRWLSSQKLSYSKCLAN